MLDNSPIPVREGLRDALERSGQRLSEPGTCWTGAERLAIAQEARQARACTLCATRRESISPHAIEGDHDTVTDLSDSTIEAVHRLVTDQGRLTDAWYKGLLDDGLTPAQFVELVGVVAHVTALDTFHRGLSLEAPKLSDAHPGDPSGDISLTAQVTMARVPTVSPKTVEGTLADHWFPGGEMRYIPRVHQALSLVPAETIAFHDIAHELYIDNPAANSTESPRAISRAQMELVAARTSSLNECFY